MFDTGGYNRAQSSADVPRAGCSGCTKVAERVPSGDRVPAKRQLGEFDKFVNI